MQTVRVEDIGRTYEKEVLREGRTGRRGRRRKLHHDDNLPQRHLGVWTGVRLDRTGTQETR